MIVLAIAILVGVTASPVGRFHGYGHHHEMSGYARHGPGRHMAAPEMMWRGRTGWHSMHDGGAMLPGMGMGFRSHYVGIVLDDEQERRMRAIWQGLDNERGMLLERFYEQQRRLENMLRADNPDAQRVGEQYLRCADLRRRILELDVEGWRQMDEVLTDVQRAEARKRRRQWPGVHRY
jgi:Spy/CpxP family protein refolding chaperone